jgi:virulence-associated protein VagC
MSTYKERHDVIQNKVGNSTSIRLTKGFSYPEGTKLLMRRYGERLVIEPEKPQGWPEKFFEVMLEPDPDFPDVTKLR